MSGFEPVESALAGINYAFAASYPEGTTASESAILTVFGCLQLIWKIDRPIPSKRY